MGEFFKGWRRKVGCVVLVMACVFAAGWIRSLCIADAFGLILKSEYDTIFVSACGSVGVVRVDNFATRGLFPATDWLTMSPSDIARIFNLWLGIDDADAFRVQFWGFSFVTREGSTGFIAPYGHIVVSLTLLSAYLLLWKPRKRTEPDHA